MREADIFDEEKIMSRKNSLITQHAKIRSGFHTYEKEAFVSKQILYDMVIQYKMFFSVDKKSSEFLEKVRKYAELDSTSSDDVSEEMDFVRDFENLAEQMVQYLDKQQKEFEKDVKAINEEEYNKMSEARRKELDYKLTMRQEAIDNRRRAVASFDMYFYALKNGDLTDLDMFSDEYKLKIDEANNKKGPLTVILKKGIGDRHQKYYINAAGVKYDKSLKGNALGKAEKALAAVGNATGFEKDMRNEPLFPHDPCMADVSQGYAGDCYIMAALQNVARLYPQKIRNMIKDNGDGTATVRLYARKLEDGNKRYFPVYVRVDKTIPKMSFGAFNRLANDCLWVNMIEKAYMMSGLHKTYDKDTNLPTKYNEKTTIVPAIDDIEGGMGGLFTETLLGEEGATTVIDLPTEKMLEDEKKQYESKVKTGTGSKKNYMKKREELLVKINDAVMDGFPMCCGTHEDQRAVRSAVNKHEYSLMGAYKTNDEPPKYFIRLNNPNKVSIFGNGVEYEEKDNEVTTKWIKIKDGIYDISMEDFVHDFESIEINGSDELAHQIHQRNEYYDIITEEDKINYKKDNMTIERLTDFMKVSNDLYEAMLATNSCFSNDSDQYKDLLEGIKMFRQGVVMSNGKSMEKVKRLANALIVLVDHYETHIGDNSAKYSNRQKSRAFVCKQIRKVVDCINNGQNPEHVFEKEFAKKLYGQYMDLNGIKDKTTFAEMSQRMYNNKAFRNIAFKTSIVTMAEGDKKQLTGCLNKIEKAHKGKGIGKGINMRTLDPKKECNILS